LNIIKTIKFKNINGKKKGESQNKLSSLKINKIKSLDYKREIQTAGLQV